MLFQLLVILNSKFLTVYVLGWNLKKEKLPKIQEDTTESPINLLNISEHAIDFFQAVSINKSRLTPETRQASQLINCSVKVLFVKFFAFPTSLSMEKRLNVSSLLPFEIHPP